MKNAARFSCFRSGFLACGLGLISSLISGVEAQPYVVYVPDSGFGTLQTVRRVAPDAFQAVIQGQPAVQAGAFNSAANADNLVATLRQSGISAQRIFRNESVTTFPANSTSTIISYPGTTYPTTSPQALPPAIAQAPPFANQFSGGFTGTNATDASGNPIQPQQFRYISIVPTGPRDSDIKLLQVRRFVPNAFLANSSRGSYIYAGAYNSREGAEALAYYLRSQGLDARVVYF